MLYSSYFYTSQYGSLKKKMGRPHASPLASQILYTRPPAYTTLTRLTARAHIVVLVALVHARRSLSR